ncbi:MAG: 2-hydroxyacyl-CoA dehydratase [Clostridia bacterium]|nr:2-hydroxyacyl-CoA dehydratase [Clostridia bacterium]
MTEKYIPFTEEMKKTHTILAPNMLPVHFKLYIQILRNCGYNIDLLESESSSVTEAGLKYVHNDTCYPAIVVIGQFLEAVKSGRYDTDKIALIMFQTGGGCRASNYIFLIRKALERAGYGHIPVISLSLAGLEKHPGFKLTLPMLYKMLYATLYGDLIMLLENQCKPYEVKKGSTKAVSEKLTRVLTDEMNKKHFSLVRIKKNYKRIIDEFGKIELKHEEKVKVGIVGEIFVKFSPAGNNGLERFLVSEGAEIVIPGFMDFMLYSIYDNIMDYRLYGRNKAQYPLYCMVLKFLEHEQKKVIDAVASDGRFRPSTPFSHTVSLVKDYIGYGCKMGEGWLLPAEMLELADSGVNNIVCTQPFGCLPNHIVGKGMMNPIKRRNPDVNIIAIDYDASASEINQQNRIKLMLANAAEKLKIKN